MYIIQKLSFIIGHYTFHCLVEGREVSQAALSLELSMFSDVHILLYASHVLKNLLNFLWSLLPGEHVILLNPIMPGIIHIQTPSCSISVYVQTNDDLKCWSLAWQSVPSSQWYLMKHWWLIIEKNFIHFTQRNEII